MRTLIIVLALAFGSVCVAGEVAAPTASPSPEAKVKMEAKKSKAKAQEKVKKTHKAVVASPSPTM